MNGELFTSSLSDPELTVYAEFSNLLGKDSQIAASYKSQLRNTLEDNSKISSLDTNEFQQLQDEIYTQIRNGDITDNEGQTKLGELYKRFEQSSQSERIEKILHQYDSRAEIEAVISDVNDIELINDLLNRVDVIAPPSNEVAPFKEFHENTGTEWKYIPDDEVRDYLLSKPFVEDQTLGRLQDNNAASVTKLENHTSEQNGQFNIPIDLIVSAANFGSWLGRDDRYGNKGMGEKDIELDYFTTSSTQRSLSLHAIKAYASQPTELPAVDEIIVFVQPNGQAFAGNATESHRVAAAILRGEKFIKASELKTVLLKDNYFE